MTGPDGDGGEEGSEHGNGERGHGHGHGHDHDHHAHDLPTVGVAVVTITSSRTADADQSGDYVADAFRDAGHEVATRELIPDDLDRVQAAVDTLTRREDVDAVVTTGGTGVTPDDVTPEAVLPLFDKQLPGFGELFRRRSEAEVGTRTIGSRAVAGIAGGTPTFCLPGSENAVRLGVDELILPEVGHLAGLAGRGADGDGNGNGAENGTGTGNGSRNG